MTYMQTIQMEAPAGFEPANAGFAVPCLTNLATVPCLEGRRYRGGRLASRSPRAGVDARNPAFRPHRAPSGHRVHARADEAPLRLVRRPRLGRWPPPPADDLRRVRARRARDHEPGGAQEYDRRAVPARRLARRPGDSPVPGRGECAGLVRRLVIASHQRAPELVDEGEGEYASRGGAARRRNLRPGPRPATIGRTKDPRRGSAGRKPEDVAANRQGGVAGRERAFARPGLRTRQLGPAVARVGGLEQHEAAPDRIRERVSARFVREPKRVEEDPGSLVPVHLAPARAG